MLRQRERRKYGSHGKSQLKKKNDAFQISIKNSQKLERQTTNKKEEAIRV